MMQEKMQQRITVETEETTETEEKTEIEEATETEEITKKTTETTEETNKNIRAVMEETISQMIEQKKQILDRMLADGYFKTAAHASFAIAQCILAGNKVMLAGNGGSAADAQHFAGELVGRFLMERRALPAVSLCTDPSVMTCIGNDYGFDAVFERQLSGIGKKGDLLIVISTSGNSENLCRAAKLAGSMGIQTIGLLGKDGGRLKELCDCALVVPTEETPRIQEMHTFTVHLLCGGAETEIVRKTKKGQP